MVGSYVHDMSELQFFADIVTQNGFTSLQQNSILDYYIELSPYGETITWDSFEFYKMNFTNAGFKMKMVRHKMKYLINYYLPPGLFVIVSWVSY